MFHAYEHGSWFVNKNYLIVPVGGGPCCALHAFDNFCGAQTLSNKGRMFLASKQTPSVRDQPRAEKSSVVIGKCTEHTVIVFTSSYRLKMDSMQSGFGRG